MNNELISILLPVKNAASYLPECLDSICQQSESHWELIAVDDHSTDNSYDILKKYAKLDPRIIVLKNEEKGIISALRKAYSNANGQYISRMDADDIMIVTKLEKLKSKLKAFGSGHISTGLVKYFSKGELGNGYVKYQNWLNALSIQENNYSNIYKECVIPSPCWMVYRQDLDDCGAFDSNTYPEDYDLCFRFYEKKLTVKTVPETIHLWRDYPERTSRNDPNYADIHFFDLKIKYFLSIDYQPEKQLLIWGAGRKGKKLAKILIDHNIKFGWITDNSKKIGHDIYGIKIGSIIDLHKNISFQAIIAVAAKDALEGIYQTLESSFSSKSENFYLFC